MLHISRFIDKIKMAESKKAKDLKMSLREAKDLHGDITKLLLALQILQEAKKPDDDKAQEVEIDGGKW